MIAIHDITREENALFSKWKKQNPRGKFFKDGAFSPEQYLRRALRTVVLLKEANAPQKDGDLREEFHRNSFKNPSFWKIMNSWCQGLLGDKPDWQHGCALGSLAFIFLKKVPGGKSSKRRELQQAAEDDRLLIRKQLAIYKPRVIIGLGKGQMFDLLQQVIFLQAKKPEKRDGLRFTKVLDKAVSPRAITIIESYHPRQRSIPQAREKLIRVIRAVAQKR